MEQIKTTLPYVGFAESKQGGRRENQDYYLVEDTPLGLLAVTCDGMGGGPAGKTASYIATQTIMDSVKSVLGTEKPEDALVDAVEKANSVLYQLAKEKPELKGMGTTVVALLISNEVATVVHVGDSRLYHLRGHKCIFTTKDHSKVAEMVRAKIITEEQARLSSMSNIITRVLGVFETCEVEIDQLPYEKGDRFVLCSDGIWGTMPANDLVTYFTRTKSLSGTVDRISVKVDEIGIATGGGHDNHTLILLETKINSKIKQKMSTKVKYLVYALSVIAIISISLNVIQYFSSENTTIIKELQDVKTNFDDHSINSQDSDSTLHGRVTVNETQNELSTFADAESTLSNGDSSLNENMNNVTDNSDTTSDSVIINKLVKDAIENK